MKIGIDFGSTYSTISAYFPNEDRVAALSLVEGESASIPSVVSLSKKGKITCGKAAKEQVGKKTVRCFEAFKMLLNEPDAKLLESRGYDSEYTPRVVTRYYLDSLLQGVAARYSVDAFEEIVVCVPEVWCRNVRTLDGRSILRDVLKNEMSVPVEQVRVVTEPEAASAFFAYYYEKDTQKPFNGHLLLIDYGGGTLDITLTEVVSDGSGKMEISFRAGCGAGENHEGTLGSAGIAFMQRVVALSMIDAGLIGSLDEVDYTDPEFIGAVRDLESQLKSPDRMKDIEDYYGSYGSGYSELSEILDEDPEEFLCLEYNDEELSVSYQNMLLAYRQVISGVLKEQIDEINANVRKQIGEDPCELSAGLRDNFKIALVGGFGSFYLVKKQLSEIYRLDANEKIDLRTKNIHADKRELAISLGAALLAAGKVTQRKTARYSIGLYSAGPDRVYRAKYAIRCLQTVEPGKPYYILRNGDEADTPDNRVVFGGISKQIKNFVISFSGLDDRGGLMTLKPAMIKRLEQIPQDGFWNCGFSLDESDIVRFHVSPVSFGRRAEAGEIVIPLDNYVGMFELTEVTEVPAE